MTDIKELEARALALPAELRADLAQRLLASLEQAPEEENERIWLEEAALRYQRYQEGAIPARDAFAALNEMRDKLR